ncbi:pro-resilin-like [Penaeus indicus]|uniref:pro-resilin-like n=1 Tax=Penaeus indicus TaxID=29960 RepID=UPI00300CD8DD
MVTEHIPPTAVMTAIQDLICEQVFLVLALSTSALCDDLGGLLHGKGIHHAPAHYAFNYGVQDAYFGTNFGHAESRDGYKTEGVFYVHLPDGRLQTVKYYADEHGFHPEVAYSGVAHHAAGYH